MSEVYQVVKDGSVYGTFASKDDAADARFELYGSSIITIELDDIDTWIENMRASIRPTPTYNH